MFKYLLNFVFRIWSWFDSAEQMFMLMSRLRYTMCRIRFFIRSQFFIHKIASFRAVSNYESSFTFDSDNWSQYAINYYSFAAAAEIFFFLTRVTFFILRRWLYLMLLRNGRQNVNIQQNAKRLQATATEQVSIFELVIYVGLHRECTRWIQTYRV